MRVAIARILRCRRSYPLLSRTPFHISQSRNSTRFATSMATENEDIKTAPPPVCENDSQKVLDTAKEEKVDEMPEQKPLPPLNAAEHRLYNSLSVKMDWFHNNFRRTWTELYNGCSTNKRPRGMSLSQYIREGLAFCQHLTMHHDIEETYIFPKLATKMEMFKHHSKNGGLMVQHHKQIHKGLVDMESYLSSCKSGEIDFRMEELKERMDSFGSVLWTHLDAEVEQLKAENMRKYWTTEEMRSLQF